MDQDTIDEARRLLAEIVALPGNEIVTVTLQTDTTTGGLGLKDDDTISQSSTTTLTCMIGPDAAPDVQGGPHGQTTTGRWRLLLPAPTGIAVADWCRTLAIYRYDETAASATESVMMINGDAVKVERIVPDYLFNAAEVTILRENLTF